MYRSGWDWIGFLLWGCVCVWMCGCWLAYAWGKRVRLGLLLWVFCLGGLNVERRDSAVYQERKKAHVIHYERDCDSQLGVSFTTPPNPTPPKK